MEAIDLDTARARRTRRKQLEGELTTLAGELHAATYRFLKLLAEFDELGGWQGPGVRSFAHWLSWRCGVGVVAAREKIRVAKALPELPAVSEKLRVGELSYSKARAITRIATPENEAFLVDVALHGTTGHLERLVRYARKYGPEEAAERAARQHAERTLEIRTDDDGAVVLRGRLPPELGALVKKALDAAVAEMKAAAREEAERARAANDNRGAVHVPDARRFGASRADALIELAESYLASGRREGSAGERNQIIVHVDADVLSAPRQGASDADSSDADSSGADSSGADSPAPYIEDLGPIAEETARRLACDASRVVMTEREGETVDVGRKTRTIPAAIRRALTHRDGGCVFPGCDCRRFVDAHHIVHWAHGGRTALDNLVLLCRRHHRLVHEEGYTIQLNRGRVTLEAPNGEVLPRLVPLHRPAEGAAAVPRANRRRGLTIGPWTSTPRWAGEAIDYNIALGALATFRRRQTEETSPPTTPEWDTKP